MTLLLTFVEINSLSRGEKVYLNNQSLNVILNSIVSYYTFPITAQDSSSSSSRHCCVRTGRARTCMLYAESFPGYIYLGLSYIRQSVLLTGGT